MAVDERDGRVIVRRRESPSTIVPNTIFAICMVVFIVFIFWQFGMRDTAPVDLSAPVTAPNPLPN